MEKNIKSTKLIQKLAIMIAMFFVAIFAANTSFAATVNTQITGQPLYGQLGCYNGNFATGRTYGTTNNTAQVDLIASYKPSFQDWTFASTGPGSNNAFAFGSIPATHPVYGGTLNVIRAQHKALGYTWSSTIAVQNCI